MPSRWILSGETEEHPTYSQARPGNPAYTTTGLRACIQEGAEAFGWREAREKTASSKKGNLLRGVGMASALWVAGGGGPPSTVIVKLFSDGSVNLNMGASDIGTGTKTVMAMVVAEELGVKLEKIQIEHADTGTTQYATPSRRQSRPYGSANGKSCGGQVKQQLLEMAARDLKTELHRFDMRAPNCVKKILPKEIKTWRSPT
jgi:xanthine dehydrogenase YagR molybdenum-binding subunit